MFLRLVPVIFAAVVMLSACSRKQADADAAGGHPAEDSAVADSAAVMRELSLPHVPAGMTDIGERAGYIAVHFWDAMNFSDRRCSLDTAFMEQNFANFISVFPYASGQMRRGGMARLLDRAADDAAAFALIAELAEKYLYDPNSPMRDEEYYILFLEELLRRPELTAEERVRPEFQLEEACKNRPGTTAADFAYVDRCGRERTLHGTGSGLLLLIFYDPDCENCAEILGRFHESTLFRQLIATGRLSVLAVYADGDRGLWNRTKDTMPAEWKVGFDTDGILDRGLYSLPATPGLYLLDRNKTVLLKEPSPMLLADYLSQFASGSTGVHPDL